MRKQMLYTRRELGMMLAPLVIEQVLVMLVGMVDTVMVSGAGEAAVSGRSGFLSVPAASCAISPHEP